MNTETPIYYSTRGYIADRITVNDCGAVGEPALIVLDFGPMSIYTRDAEQLLDNMRAATLQLAQLMAKHRDEKRAENE